ncbi:MAG: CRISPR-associated protein Csx16 [Candidatus Lokiarchaeota archaeon]
MKLNKIIYEFKCEKCGYVIKRDEKYGEQDVVCPMCYKNTKNNLKIPKIVVTRHKDLISFLKHKKVITDDTPVISYAKSKDIIGKHVIGKLPFHMAANTTLYSEVRLRTPADKKGEELTAEEIDFYFVDTNTYCIVRKGTLL